MLGVGGIAVLRTRANGFRIRNENNRLCRKGAGRRHRCGLEYTEGREVLFDVCNAMGIEIEAGNTEPNVFDFRGLRARSVVRTQVRGTIKARAISRMRNLYEGNQR